MKSVYDPKTKKMITPEQAKTEKGEYGRISLDGNLFNTLKGYASADGISFAGKTAKRDAAGEVVTDKDGNTVTVDVAESKAKVNNAVRADREIAIREFVAAREAVSTDEN